MKRLLTFLLATLMLIPAFGQSFHVWDSPYKKKEKAMRKEKKAFIKQMRKEQKLEDIRVVYINNEQWFYVIYGKKAKMGIATPDGRVIIQPIYDFIEYYPEEKEGYDTDYTFFTNYWHRKTEAIFLATISNYRSNRPSTYAIYGIDGSKKMADTGFRYFRHIPGYFKTEVGSVGDSTDGLITTDGEEILPPEYELISMKGKVLTYTKTSSHLKGMKSLDHSTPEFPCQFEDIKYDSIQNCWMVQEPDSYEWSVYDTKRAYASEIKDDGARYYWDKKYDDAIKFYSRAGIDKPWAKFYMGASMLKKAEKMSLDALTFNYFYNQGKMDNILSGNTTWRTHYAGLDINLNLARDFYINGYTLLYEYLSVDTIYKKEALEKIKEPIESQLNLIEYQEKEFVPLWEKFQKENSAIAARQAQIREQQRQQNAMFASILMGVVQSVISNIGNSGSQSAAPAVRNSTYTSSTFSSSSSSNNNASKIQEWENRKRNAQDLLTKYRAQQVTEPDAAYLKHNIRSQEEIIRTCDEAIARLKQ